ncbi:7,8-didemethyl-8-hydroxy-5-deazariboflavin synthase CofG [Microbacterium saperdae]|uniref:7,8-didemethyl-8-hydroxy-5-deazariboflavin synthase n=1 Tax=Microbacterium saperdae TaxID=69368 RepID=A0A543BL85_9MICO|nr:7,8-didemethyl-8-hydroxy-5-deazariboflavin synthase CofG [Microbacterium saperdae]TQL85589.1 FO synthase subunit 1 [Microbacterium saperdae]GGM62453.1 FO synthase [Microbacterium saperdae]
MYVSAEATQVERLLGARGDALDDLLDHASSLRDEGLNRIGRPKTITYSRKAFIPLTTLCRDRCHYCTFVDTPSQLRRKGQRLYMSEEQVLTVARRGAALGCKEALLTLGDRPESRWPQAREWLDEHGFASTLDYVGAMARLIREETGLLPHLNPGVMSHDEMVTLRPTAPSMGMMLETTSRALFTEPGRAHYGSPDKDPAVRLRVIEDAGRARIPFTTGVLIGIGESLADRAESLLRLRDLHERYGHIQEVIVQNFRAKSHTVMQSVPDAHRRDYLAAVAVARIVFGPDMRIQVPPNLSDPTEFESLIRAGIDDWGGVSPLTADHVNPERPWPQIDDLAALTAGAGFRLRERLTVHPSYLREPTAWIDDALVPAVLTLADPLTMLASEREPSSPMRGHGENERGSRVRRSGQSIVDRASADPENVDDAEWAHLLHLTGDGLERLAVVADEVRRFTVGESIGLVANRNVTSTYWSARPMPGRFTIAGLAAIVDDAAETGATEICLQGQIPREEPDDGYLQLARIVKATSPDLHLHAFRPGDICDHADRMGVTIDDAVRDLREAGVDTIPGTGVKILSERVRARSGPEDIPVDRWIDVIIAAHRAGLRSSSVIHYGHAESADERVAHLRKIIEIQRLTGGFTEMVPMPHPHGVPLVSGRSPEDEHRAMFAVARLMLSSTVPHIQVPWTRLNDRHILAVLRSGGDDLGGTLFDGRILPAIGAEHGREMRPSRARGITASLFRPLRQRTTDYKDVPAERRIL